MWLPALRPLLLLCAVTFALCSERWGYHFVDKALTWSEAQQFCRQHHSDLAGVSSSEDNHRLPRPKDYSAPVWLGLSADPTNMTQWTWTTSATGPAFRSWGPQEPLYFHQPQICAALSQDGWHSSPCSGARRALCFTEVVIDNNTEVRLGGGPSRCEGTLEVKYGAEWIRVTTHYETWEPEAGAAVCEEQQCGAPLSSAQTGDFPSGKIWLIDTDCVKNKTVSSCFSYVFFDSNTGIKVVCSGAKPKLYHLSSASLSWSDAVSFCRKTHTDLALIESSQENAAAVAAAGANSAWIGLHRPGGQWSDGRALTFTAWEQPGGGGVYHEPFCAVENSDQSWNTSSCLETRPFYCQEPIVRRFVRIAFSADELAGSKVTADMLEKIQRRFEAEGRTDVKVKWTTAPQKQEKKKEEREDCPDPDL